MFGLFICIGALDVKRFSCTIEGISGHSGCCSNRGRLRLSWLRLSHRRKKRVDNWLDLRLRLLSREGGDSGSRRDERVEILLRFGRLCWLTSWDSVERNVLERSLLLG